MSFLYNSCFSKLTNIIFAATPIEVVSIQEEAGEEEDTTKTIQAEQATMTAGRLKQATAVTTAGKKIITMLHDIFFEIH